MALVYLPCAIVGIQFGPFVETHLTINLSFSEHTCQDVSQDETSQVSILVPDVLNNKISYTYFNESNGVSLENNQFIIIK